MRELLVCLAVCGCSAEPPAVVDAALPDVSFVEDAHIPSTELVTHRYRAELDFDGHGPMMQFDLPEGVESVQIQMRGESGMVMAVDWLEGPDGQRLVDPNPPGYVPSQTDLEALYFAAAFHSPNRSVWGQRHAVTLVPDTPAVALTPGTWRARVSAVDAAEFPLSGTVDAEVVVKRALSAPAARGVLNVNLHLASSRFEARTAASDPVFRALLGHLVAYFAPVGIELQFRQPIQLSTTYRAPVGAEATQAVFESGVLLPGLNVFIIDSLNPSGELPLGGQAGSIPGPHGWNGASVAGVILAGGFSEDPAVLARVLAHEMGHYLGLFHTIEPGVGYEDPLPDTDPTPDGAGNMMYPDRSSEGPVAFSAEQGWVMRHSPLVVGE